MLFLLDEPVLRFCVLPWGERVVRIGVIKGGVFNDFAYRLGGGASGFPILVPEVGDNPS